MWAQMGKQRTTRSISGKMGSQVKTSKKNRDAWVDCWEDELPKDQEKLDMFVQLPFSKGIYVSDKFDVYNEICDCDKCNGYDDRYDYDNDPYDDSYDRFEEMLDIIRIGYDNPYGHQRIFYRR